MLPQLRQLSQDRSMIWSCWIGFQRRGASVADKSVAEDECATTTKSLHLGRDSPQCVESQCGPRVLGDQANVRFAGEPLRHGRSDRGAAWGAAVRDGSQDARLSERVYAT